ncbi:TetR/AcrR family transcriptional regulator [Mycetocola zhadangensis]|uniref:TetR family transcriptional regulator n=1 Tax=Mycetocola zhadangensis TaxID=1164595 RepID=A0A3L7ITB9_9MICO|nr:TetR/AcrR family transcriptional regulator C-terminal domain-containing protein [Mycetocola zhadangensis]RLQ81415.1 TetR family transcriptional regulator [Mycetocola zhadangensis]GGF01916.1 TetR family transcriptional regulator [Mycetocola zhadangensis]
MQTDNAEPELELPRAIALAWGVATNPQRGPKRELSIEGIVETAIDIADAGGLAAVSMSSVASRLGFTTMSLYRYVSAKDDLILLMLEHGMGVPPAVANEPEGWRKRLSTWHASSLACYAAHPWMLDIPINGIPMTPNNLAWMDSALDALADTSLQESQRLAAALAVTGHARWQAMIERGYRDASTRAGMNGTEFDRLEERVLGSLATPERFPAVHRVVQAGAIGPDSSLNPFEFGLNAILDGIQAAMAARIVPEHESTRAEPAPAPEAFPKDKAVREASRLRRDAEVRLREALRHERDAIAQAREAAERIAKSR